MEEARRIIRKIGAAGLRQKIGKAEGKPLEQITVDKLQAALKGKPATNS